MFECISNHFVNAELLTKMESLDEIKEKEMATRQNLFKEGDDPVVVVAALRTPMCKAKRGSFSSTTPDHLLATVLKAVLEKSQIKPDSLGEICVGCVLSPGRHHPGVGSRSRITIFT